MQKTFIKNPDLNCPACHNPDLTVNDFYWCNGTNVNPCKNGEDCKKCQAKKRAEKKEAEKEYAKQFFVA